MLKSLVAAGLVAGGLLSFPGPAVAAPVGLKGAALTDNSALIQVHRGFRGHHGFHRHRHHGGVFLYGALPFIGYGAYSYGYRYSDCGWLRHRYYVTGSRYWYWRWAECRGWY